MKKILLVVVLIVALSSMAGCSSFNNSFNKFKAGTTSSDYVVIKYNLKGEPVRYWILRDNFVNNEESSDGYYWSDSHGGINRVTNSDAMDIRGETDAQAIATYHLEKAMRIND